MVATVHIGGETFLAKNRDRAYAPESRIIHELIDGVEVLYIHDELTDWSEGINEFGVGIVNASLMVHYDEMEGDMMRRRKLAADNDKDKDKDKTAAKPSYDGLKIRTALSKPKLADTLRSIVHFAGDDKKDVGVKGMTMVASLKHAFVVEMTSEHLPVIKKIDKPKVTVRTNHGVAYPDTGYTEGEKRKSSLSRMRIAEKELAKIKDSEEILPVLTHQWTEDPFLNPYRRENPYDMLTRSQVLLNLDKRQMWFRYDDDSKFAGYINRLPKGYKAKIELMQVDLVK